MYEFIHEYTCIILNPKSDTSRHVNEVVINHYQPIVDRLKREIDEKLEKLGYPSRIENSLVDNHEGLKKEPGLVIQPNVIRPLS